MVININKKILKLSRIWVKVHSVIQTTKNRNTTNNSNYREQEHHYWDHLKKIEISKRMSEGWSVEMD